METVLGLLAEVREDSQEIAPKKTLLAEGFLIVGNEEGESA